MVKKYDIKLYKKDGREGSTVRGLTFGQAHTLIVTLNEYKIKHIVKEIK